MSESPRLDRIEQIVISLEADMKIMANSVSSMAGSMEKFVEMQTDHKLLKQEMKHNCDYVHTKLREFEAKTAKIDEDIAECKTHYEHDIKEKFKILEPVVMLIKYPKITLPVFILIYLFTFQEIRHLMLPFL